MITGGADVTVGQAVSPTVSAYLRQQRGRPGQPVVYTAETRV